MIKETALSKVHKALGAKMVEFAGYSMPLIYSDISSEHRCVRDHVGLFDVSHMGEFIISGSESTELVSYVTSNDPTKLIPGRVQYAYLPNENGGIVDDLLVYRLSDDQDGYAHYMLVVNASNIDKDYRWIVEHNTFKASCKNISEDISLFALQGPKAQALLQELVTESIDMKYYHFGEFSLSGHDGIIISATGYTGAGGYELYVPRAISETIWDLIYQRLPTYNGLVVGLGARDTLRLEKGYCLYGNDIDDNTSPLEAGLGWITKLKKGDFIGRKAIIEYKEKGIRRKLVGFKVNDRRVARSGYRILHDGTNLIGRTTSGCVSPSLGYPIGLGYIDIEFSEPNTQIQIDTGRKLIDAVVQDIPFV